MHYSKIRPAMHRRDGRGCANRRIRAAVCATTEINSHGRRHAMKCGPGNQNTSEPRSDSGFILVVVLWILAALAKLASVYSILSRQCHAATQINDDRLRIRNAISTGIELSAYQLLAVLEQARPAQGAFTVRLARATIDASFVSENGRVNLNAPPRTCWRVSSPPSA